MSSVLSGFTITNGLTFPFQGGGILIENASATISGNVISNNRSCADGAGIGVHFGSPLIIGNSIIDNHQGNCGGGGGGGIGVVGLSKAGPLQIISNTISNNSWTGGNGGGIELIEPEPEGIIVKDNLISGNSARPSRMNSTRRNAVPT